MNQIIPENRKISPFFVFFLIPSMQVGIGILGFQRMIAKSAGYDAWISIIITGCIIHILVWMMYKMLKIVDGDIVAIHAYIFGKKLGKFISSIFIIYFCLFTVTVLRNYIEVVQVWMFEDLETFWFALVFLILVIYIINGSFRTVTGIAFFSSVLPFYMIFLFFFTFPFADFTNLLPILNHSVKELVISSRDMSLTVLGFESLLVYYPFIKEPGKSKKWAHLGILFTTILCLYLAIITFAYFSEEQLQKNLWPTLTMWKIIKMPFIERFEYIGIANWCLIILPNVCIALWCASRVAKQLFSFRQKTSVLFFSFLCLIVTSLLTTKEQIDFLSDILAKVGFYFNFIYIPILFAITLIVKKVKSRENHS